LLFIHFNIFAIIENQNDVWGVDLEATDAICLEALNKFMWGEDYSDDERALNETYSQIESCT